MKGRRDFTTGNTITWAYKCNKKDDCNESRIVNKPPLAVLMTLVLVRFCRIVSRLTPNHLLQALILNH